MKPVRGRTARRAAAGAGLVEVAEVADVVDSTVTVADAVIVTELSSEGHTEVGCGEWGVGSGRWEMEKNASLSYSFFFPISYSTPPTNYSPFPVPTPHSPFPIPHSRSNVLPAKNAWKIYLDR